MKQSDRDAAEAYALAKAIHFWERATVYGPSGDFKSKPSKGSTLDVETFLAGVAHARKGHAENNVIRLFGEGCPFPYETGRGYVCWRTLEVCFEYGWEVIGVL